MKHASPFVISEFTNPSAKIVFQLYARLDGKRFRKNIPTRAEADAERQVEEVQWLQHDTDTRAAITRLDEDQLHEAEAVFRRVAGRPHPLSFYVEFALANYREPVTQKLLSEAVTEFLLIKDHEREQDLISEPYLTRVKRDLDRLQKHFPGATVAELTGTRLLGYFEARGAAHKTFNNRRGVVSALLKFALQRDWIAETPLTKIPPHRLRRRRGCAITFAAQQATDLMAYVEAHYPINLLPVMDEGPPRSSPDRILTGKVNKTNIGTRPSSTNSKSIWNNNGLTGNDLWSAMPHSKNLSNWFGGLECLLYMNERFIRSMD